MHHELHALPKTVHWGFFDSRLEPALSVESGDRVTIHTVSGGGPPDLLKDKIKVLPELKSIQEEVERGAGPHIMTGPIWVKGAEPGDVLEVRIEDVQLRQDWGWNLMLPLMGALSENFCLSRYVVIPLDRERMVAKGLSDTQVPLRPFFGILVVAPPPRYGRVSSFPPREYGGNMDNKELVPGTTLYLPVFNPGALFSAGDGHAAQGDGEVNLTAIETAMTGVFTLIVRKDLSLKVPRAETPTHHITMGFDPDLDDAVKGALREMIKFLVEVQGLSPEDAYTLCSIAVDFRVTQLVNSNKGIHAMLPKDIF